MKNLIERLTALSDQNDNFDLVPEKEIIDLYKAYCATGKYPYLNDVAKYIKGVHGLPDNLDQTVYHQCYLTSQYCRVQKEKEQAQKLEAEGWVKITLANWSDIPTEGKAELYLDTTSDLFGGVKTVACRLTKNTTPQGVRAFFLPPKAKRKGYDAYSLACKQAPAFYRVIA